jgi:CRISPR-associated protein Cmr2
MSPSYVGITIGPMDKTFREVRKTRELWAASYLFSLLSEQLLLQLKGKTIIMPFTSVITMGNNESFDIMNNKSGVGLFPDRIIYEGTADDLAKLRNTHIPAVIDAIAVKFEMAPAVLQRYLRIQSLCKKIAPEENPIIVLSPYLDALELQDKIESTEADEDQLFTFFNKVNTSTFFKTLFADGKGKALPGCMIKDINGQARFESLVEISTRALQGDNDAERKQYKTLLNHHIWNDAEPGERDGDEAFLNNLKDECMKEAKSAHSETRFKASHKYICIVKADGDKIGKTLEGLRPGDLPGFSEKLLRWGIATREAIHQYKGVPVYIGGDDVLFFAPVSNGQQTIIDLVNTIDGLFAEIFAGFSTKPTLSYGISISYYKYPLYEAVQAADELLYEAKEVPGKNAIALRILKHSGSILKWKVSKDTPIYTQHFRELLAQLEKDKSFINSAAFRIRDNEALFEVIGNDQDRVQAFFNNNFNEDVHSEKRSYINAVAGLLPALVKHHEQLVLDRHRKAITADALSDTYTILKTINFLNGLDDEH